MGNAATIASKNGYPCDTAFFNIIKPDMVTFSTVIIYPPGIALRFPEYHA